MNKKLILIVLGLVCMAAVFIGIGFWWANQQATPPLQEDAIDWEGSKTEYNGSSQSDKGIAIPGMDVMNFQADERKQAVNLYNPAENHCYFKISLLLADGTLLYQSNLIAPGKGLYEIELLKTLSEGVYDASVLKYECFSMDEDYTPLNGAELTLTIQSIS